MEKWRLNEGQMLNGKMHGKGIYKYKNGKIFKGNFPNGIRYNGRFYFDAVINEEI